MITREIFLSCILITVTLMECVKCFTPTTTTRSHAFILRQKNHHVVNLSTNQFMSNSDDNEINDDDDDDEQQQPPHIENVLLVECGMFWNEDDSNE